jgi:ribosomal protein L31E
MGLERKEAEAWGRMAAVRVAKDVFLDAWFEEGASFFPDHQRAVLRQIVEESRQEREELLALVERWARLRVEERERTERAARVIEAHAKRDFLDDAIRIKNDSAELIQKAGLLAPQELRGAFFRLAVLDAKHALMLQDVRAESFRHLGELFGDPDQA